MEALEDDEDAFKILRLDANAIVRHREPPATALAARSDMEPGRLLAAELDSIAQEVLEHVRQLGGVGLHHRELVVGDDGCRLLDGGFEVGQRLGQNRPAIARLKRLAARTDPRVGQQILDERLHPPDAINRVGDQLVGPGIELALVALLEYLHAPAHGPQRLLQVVGGNVGELLQVQVGACQLLRGPQQFCLGAFSLGNVPYNPGEEAAPAQAEFADGEVHWKSRPVVAATDDLAADADDLCLPGAKVFGDVVIVPAGIRFGHQHLDVLSDDLGRRVAEDPLRRRVERRDRAVLIDGDDPVNHVVHDGSHPLLGLGRFRGGWGVPLRGRGFGDVHDERPEADETR